MFASILLAVPFLAAAVNAGACTRDYIIQQNDICDSISAAKNVSTYQLSTINRGVIDDVCGNLVPGNKICLGYEGEDCSKTYVVQKGNTCEGIAAVHGLNTTILTANNPQINEDCDNIYVGEVLCVSGSVQVPPVPADGHKPATTVPATAAPANTGKPKPNAPEQNVAAPPPAPTQPPAPAPDAPAPAPDAPAPAPDAPAPAPVDNQNEEVEEDDEDLPWCDEVEY